MIKKLAAILTLTTCTLSCSSSDDPKLGLKSPPKPEDEVGISEEERLRRMQLVRVVRADGTPEYMDGNALTVHLGNEANCPLPATPNCYSAQYALRNYCLGDLLLQATNVRSTPLTFTSVPDYPVYGTPSRQYSIPPQSEAGNATLAKLAAERANTSAGYAVGILRSGNSTPSDTDCTSHRTLFTNTFVEAYHMGREAFQRAVEATTAVADAQYSTTRSQSLAAARAVSGSALSRVAAVQLLVGGREGLHAFPGGFCTSPRLSQEAQRAMSALRESGVAPAAILFPQVTTRVLLEGTGLPDGNVRDRLAALWQSSALAGQSLTTYLGITEADFTEARRYLAQEILAFGRSPLAKLDAPMLAGGTTGPQPYVATAAPPQGPPPEAFLAALARAKMWPASVGVGASVNPLRIPSLGSRQASESLAAFTDAALTQLDDLLRSPNGAALSNDDKNALSSLAVEGKASRKGRIRVCTGTPNATVYVSEHDTSAATFLVLGEDALRCYTEGHIEGARCPNPLPAFVASGGTILTNQLGFERTTQLTLAPSIGARYYVLKRRSGYPASVHLGAYEATTGFTYLPSTDPEDGPCVDIQVIPSIEKQATRLLAPSPKWCTHQNLTCAGTVFDDRMPLENELTDNNDGVESSWKHYLALAKQAASESDLLGETYLRESIEQDQQALVEQQQRAQVNQELEEVQKYCGTAIDPSRLLLLLSTANANGTSTNDLSQLRTTKTCTTDASCGTGAADACNVALQDGTLKNTCKCIVNICVRDPMWIAFTNYADPDLRRLAECLGEPPTGLPLATSGNVPLCVWQGDPNAGGNPNDLCVGATATNPCPAVPTNAQALADGTVNPPTPTCTAPPAGNRRVDVLPLGYFDVNSTPPAPMLIGTDVAKVAYDRVRELRRFGAGPAWFEALKGTNFFNTYNVNGLAGRLGWEARIGSYSAITLNGATMFATGDIDSGVPATPRPWPCGTVDAGCTGGAPSLFCSTYDCTTVTGRMQANERMLGAVEGAIMIARGDDDNAFKNVKYPFRAQDSYLSDPSRSRVNRSNPAIANGLIAVDSFTQSVKKGDKEIRKANVTAYRASTGNPWGTELYETSQGAFAIGNIRSSLLEQNSSWPKSDVWFAGFVQSTRYETRPFTIDPKFRSETGFFFNYFSSRVSNVPQNRDYASGLYDDLPYILITKHPHYSADTLKYFLDGAELLARAGQVGANPCGGPPPQITSMDGLGAAKQYLDCAAAGIERSGALTVFANMPPGALDALRKESVIGAYPASGGTSGAAIARLRGALVSLSSTMPNIAFEVRQLGNDLEDLRVAIATQKINAQIADVQFRSSVANQIAQCAQTASSSLTSIAAAGPVLGGIAAVGSSVAACGNALAQIGYAGKLRDLSQDQAELGKQAAVIEFRRRFETRAQALANFSTKLGESIEEIDAQLADLEGGRLTAKRALARALDMQSKQHALHMSINAGMRTRLNTTRIRYDHARKNAILMAFTAKRAVEQRLGLKLAEMTEDLPLVEAPANWEATVCTLSGIDYEKLQSTDAGSNAATTATFAESYVGDYVDRLANVVESYSMKYNFQDGTDRAVISLRDDVQNVRADCEVPVGNLLYHSGSLDQQGSVSAGTSGWELENCAVGTYQGVSAPQMNCITPRRKDSSPLALVHPDLGNTPAYQVAFGTGDTPGGTGCSTGATCGLTATAALFQRVQVPAGRYRLSWFASTADTASGANAVSVVAANGTTFARQPFLNATTLRTIAAATGWTRNVILIDVPDAQEIKVSIKRPVPIPPATTPVPPASVMLAGFMLEPVIKASAGPAAQEDPAPYVGTGATLTRVRPVCEDRGGTVFRAKSWQRGCLNLCADGYAAECRGSAARSHCYWETQFNVSQRAIENDDLLKASGFARGNFNYRIERVGVNLVGTGIRDCSNVETTSACYGSGFATYTLLHNGPFFVRNHFGNDVLTELFDGRIEHARALANERYVTNPVSSSDESLIGQYLRQEFQGRPLDGNFALRIWDEEGVDFNAIEDVQLVLDYRYWTRNQ